MKRSERSTREAIAIIGMSSRFPGASDPDALWKAIVEKRDCVADYPGGRSPELDAFYAQAGKANRPPSRRGGFLPDTEKFDAAFFEIAPREAEWTDPQQRLLLELAWEAFEDAGQTREQLAGGKAGVFVGVWTTDYDVHANANAPVADFFQVTGGLLYGAASRIAYQLNLHGPDISVNAACASSLVAVHLAARSLRMGESSLALAGGVNMIFRHEVTQAFSGAGMLSKDGRCKFGDASADGFVRSEGAGLLVLKRLSDARRDGDRILGLIRGTAVVNGGRITGSMSTPSEEGQRQAMLDALADAQVDPASIHYVEAHGTGTLVGDPVELAAIGSVFGHPSGRTALCRVGSVKANIGHTESAAGVAGLIKTVHAFRHQFIPPAIHVEKLNPAVDWGSLGIALEREGSVWDADDGTPRRASVNGLGLTGTNVHVVLEEAPLTKRVETRKCAAYILPISAASEPALKQRAREMAAKLMEMEKDGFDPAADLGDLCYTAAARRTHLAHRLAVAGATSGELARELNDWLQSYASSPQTLKSELSSVRSVVSDGGSGRKVAFVFPGQGSQWIGMGRELLKTEPAFRHALEVCDGAIQKEAGWSLLQQIEETSQEERLARIDVIQPTLFAIEVALAELWKSWGITPAAVIGHSMGEVAAAYIAGILLLEDAVKVICRRSALLMRVAGSGAMVVVDLSAGEAERVIAGLGDRISIAVSNSPRSTVLAGDPKALDGVVERLEQQEVFCRWVRVDVASHSPQMDPLKDDLSTALKGLLPRPGAVALCSTVRGSVIDGAQMDTAYWVSNLRETVQFAAAVEEMIRQGFDTFIEMSPHPILTPFVEQAAEQVGKQVLSVGSLRREEPETAAMLLALGKLYVHGVEIDWRRIYPAGNHVNLPRYPWQRERFWIESSTARKSFAQAEGHPLIGEALRVGTGEWIWTAKLTSDAQPWLKDHAVEGSVLLPASAYAEIARAAAQRIFDQPGTPREPVSAVASDVVVEQLHLDHAVMLGPGNSMDLQLVASPESEGSFQLEFFSRQGERSEWTRVARATLRQSPQLMKEKTGLSAWEEAEFSTQAISGRSHGESLAHLGYDFGSSFRQIEWLALQPGSGLASIRVPVSLRSESYPLHPATLDAALQLLVRLLLEKSGGRTLLPAAFDRLEFAATRQSSELLYARATMGEGAALKGDVAVYDGAGFLLVRICGLEFKPLAAESAEGPASMLYQIAWEKLPELPASTTNAKETTGSWLLIADRGGAANRLASAFSLAGASARVASLTEVLDSKGLLADGLRGVVLLTPLDLSSCSTLPQAETVHADAAGLVRHLIDAREEAESRSVAPNPRMANRPVQEARLWFVTRGAQSAEDAQHEKNEPVTNPLAAGLWGLAASISNERPELHASCVDLSSEPDAEEFGRLARELIAGEDAERILLRGSARYTTRLKSWEAGVNRAPLISAGDLLADSPLVSSGESRRFELALRVPGSLDSFELRSSLHPEPGLGELEIAVEAGGLNFRDVLRAMALNEALSGSYFGGECAGTVLRIGPGVTGFAPGDSVIAIPRSFQNVSLLASRVTVPAELAVLQPKNMNFSEAAGLPCAFLTAYYGLVKLAQLKQGEKVLIHAATGGVGLAAIQIARWIGAEIYATAGSQEKRAYLESLGIQHVMQSRTLDFREAVLEKTRGAGVDVVLNSLAGPAIGAGLATLASYGRFVEIGKRDIWENSKISLRPLERNRSFFAVDLSQAVEDSPSMVGEMFREVMDLFGRGVFTPLPVKVFPVSQASEAFRMMAQARHMGKIVLAMRDSAAFVRLDCSQISGHGTYLITGGLGGLGLVAAETLVAYGARHLVLTSRRPESERAQSILADLRKKGASITVRLVDVANAFEVDALFAEIAAKLPPLRGVVHAAGVLDDAVVGHLSREKFATVMAGKVGGALALDKNLQPSGLDFLVYYSSVAGLLGSPGQGNYAASNAILDSLAHAQRSRGIPAISIDWGTWAEVGLAAMERTRGERLAGHGIIPLTPAQGTQLLIHILSEAPVQAAAMRFDAAAWCASYPAAKRSGMFATLLGRATKPSAGDVDFAENLSHLPVQELRETLAIWLREQVAAVLRCPVERVLPDKTLRSLGLDSLMGLEFRNRLERGLGLRFSATTVWNYPTVTALVRHLEAKLAVHAGAEQERKVEAPVVPESRQTSAKPVDSERGWDSGECSAAELLEAELLGVQSLLSK